MQTADVSLGCFACRDRPMEAAPRYEHGFEGHEDHSREEARTVARLPTWSKLRSLGALDRNTLCKSDKGLPRAEELDWS